MATAPQRHRAHYIFLALVLAWTTALASGCDAYDNADHSDEWRTVQVREPHLAFEAQLPHGWAITEVRDPDTCGAVTFRVEDADELKLVVTAVPTSCPQAGTSSQIGNGFHGLYRTVADVPDPRGAKPVHTGLGTGSAFTQDYFECTNSCHHWAEPVAIVTLEQPVDPAYPTLVVRGEEDRVDLPTLRTVAAHMTPVAG